MSVPVCAVMMGVGAMVAVAVPGSRVAVGCAVNTGVDDTVGIGVGVTGVAVGIGLGVGVPVAMAVPTVVGAT